jgi:GT2 family glycosyltransferase
VGNRKAGGLNIGNRPLVSVLVVNHNSGTCLVDCLRSLARSAYTNLELIVVDNASSDDSVTRVEALHEKVKIIRNPVNIGYSRAVNIGIANAHGEFHVIMNSDAVVDSDWLSGLIDAAARHPRAAFFQPKILLMDNPLLLNSAGNMIHVAGFGICRGIGKPNGNQFLEESEIGYASGACLLARTEAIHEIGMMETLFFAYGEDKDWGWRARMMGWQSVYVPSSKILHKWSLLLGDSPSKFYFLEFERLSSTMKNYSARTLLLLVPTLVLAEVSVLVYAFSKGWLARKIQSYADILRLRHVISEKRRTVQVRRVIPDRLVMSNFAVEIDHPYIGRPGRVFTSLMKLLFRAVSRWI